MIDPSIIDATYTLISQQGDEVNKYRLLKHIFDQAEAASSIDLSLSKYLVRIKTRLEDDKLLPMQYYAKWQGLHWMLYNLADICPEIKWPLKDQIGDLADYWLGDRYTTAFVCKSEQESYRQPSVPIINGLYRRCASQQAAALFIALKMGIRSIQVENLVELLLKWQWPDGGWNCDKNPKAIHSSYTESIIPLRALNQYYLITNDTIVGEAVNRAADVFLMRQLYIKIKDGNVIHPEFTYLHYPLYWHYDILGALKVMAECNLINDPRCRPAIELLCTKLIKSGGWPAEKSYYKFSAEVALGNDYIQWGGSSKRRMNEWVTIDALYVLHKAKLL